MRHGGFSTFHVVTYVPNWNTIQNLFFSNFNCKIGICIILLPSSIEWWRRFNGLWKTHLVLGSVVFFYVPSFLRMDCTLFYLYPCYLEIAKSSSWTSIPLRCCFKPSTCLSFTTKMIFHFIRLVRMTNTSYFHISLISSSLEEHIIYTTLYCNFNNWPNHLVWVSWSYFSKTAYLHTSVSCLTGVRPSYFQ